MSGLILKGGGWEGGGGRDRCKGENPLCDATAFDGFRRPLKCKFYRIKLSIIENRIQRCINQIFIPR